MAAGAQPRARGAVRGRVLGACSAASCLLSDAARALRSGARFFYATASTGLPTMSTIIESIEQRQLKKVPRFAAGDRVRVHFQVIEGTRRRTQVFEGIVIARQGCGARETFTVRKQSFGVGVERTFPLHSPKIERLEVVARGRRPPGEALLPARPGRQARPRRRAPLGDRGRPGDGRGGGAGGGRLRGRHPGGGRVGGAVRASPRKLARPTRPRRRRRRRRASEEPAPEAEGGRGRGLRGRFN